MPLTSHQLIQAGIKPGEIFGKCLKLDSIEQAKTLYDNYLKEKRSKQQNHKSVKMIEGSVWEWLCNHPLLQGFYSVETPGKIASNSEKRRWIEQGCINLNGKTGWNPDEPMENPWQLVFFPNSSTRRCTMLTGDGK